MPAMIPAAGAALTGARLRERRQALGLRQAVVAGMAGISASYLNLIEHNRRNVTPEVLERLAGALGVAVRDLSDGTGSSALIEDLRASAAALPDAGAEIARVEDFAGRFPGWARLTADLHGRGAQLERAVAALNDRLGHDPHLSAALHELLSALSGVRSTAAILAETEDLSPDWQSRFHRNLHQDSERLAEGAAALVGYLDRSEACEEAGGLAPQDEVEHWLASRDWHLAELEEGGPPPELQFGSRAAEALAQAHIARASADAHALPLADFNRALQDIGADPARLALQFGASIPAVMRRIALLPGAMAGLAICDGSGTLIFRKPAPGFSLPRFGAACPLWPLFSALARPGLALEVTVETPSPGGGRFRALAYCETRQPLGFNGPELREAVMLLLPERNARPDAPFLPVGSTCRICPRPHCPARREPSILGEAA